MRTSPAIGAPWLRLSPPLRSVSSRFEKPPVPRSKTPCTHQSVAPAFAGACFTARLANAGAIGHAYRAAGPVERLTGRFRRQQVVHDGLEKIHRLVEAVFHRRIAQAGQTHRPRPTRGIA